MYLEVTTQEGLFTSECIAIVNSFMPKFITTYLRNKMTINYDKILCSVLSGD